MYDKIKCVEKASVRVTQLQAIHNLFAKASLYWNPKLKKKHSPLYVCNGFTHWKLRGSLFISMTMLKKNYAANKTSNLNHNYAAENSCQNSDTEFV